MAGVIDKLRLVLATKEPKERKPPRGGRVYVPDPSRDLYRRYLSDTPTFARIKNYLRAGDQGNLADTLRLFEEMEEKDPDLTSVANTRRLAVTGLDWEVSSAAEGQEKKVDKKLADEAADYVKETLTNLAGPLRQGESEGDEVGFDEALEYLGLGVGRGLSVVETVWEGGEPACFVPVPTERLTQDLSVNANVRVTTADEPLGIDTADHWGKFVIHKPHSLAAWPLAGALQRSAAFIWLVKLLCTADWSTFCELFGMPVRYGTYQSGATTEEKAELADMLENMGTRAWAMFSQAVQLELKESSQRGTAPFKDLIDFCTRAMAKVYLGGHLTSDTTGGTGTYAAGAVQNEVRADIRDDDIRKEQRTIRRQLIEPMCALRFGRADVPLPAFSRTTPEVKDRMQEAQLIAVATQQIGLRVGQDYVYETLEMPKPSADEPVIEQIGDPFTEGGRMGMGAAWPEG